MAPPPRGVRRAPAASGSAIGAASRLLTLAVVALVASGAAAQQVVMPFEEKPPPCIGETPANVVIDKMLPYPETGSLPYLVLRNIGGQPANLTGWRITDSDGAEPYVFTGKPPCDEAGNFTIEPSRTLTIKPGGPCGWSFELNFQDAISLANANGTVVSSVEWNQPVMGRVLYRDPSGSGYLNVSSKQNVLDVLKELGDYDTFLEALEVTGLSEKLMAESDPAYEGPPGPPTEPTQDIVPEFPWWFGFGVNRSSIPPPPPPPPPPKAPQAGIPSEGPYTVLAPTDEAFEALLRVLGGGRPVPKAQLLQLPELEEILRYHILPGLYKTNDMYNNTGIFSAQGPQVTPFTDACMTEGATRLHDSCIDKPTPDNFTCAEQVVFEKCYFPFMTSALAAQWQGGFCQSTCQRCSCADGSGVQCAEVELANVKASNGVVHGISRVMFPPPVFTKEMYANETVTQELEAALTSDTPLNVQQGNASPPGTGSVLAPAVAAQGKPAISQPRRRLLTDMGRH